MTGRNPGCAIKPKAFAWLDANASVLTPQQLHEGLVAEFGVAKDTAVVYTSQWRKSHGVQRKYTRKVVKE